MNDRSERLIATLHGQIILLFVLVALPPGVRNETADPSMPPETSSVSSSAETTRHPASTLNVVTLAPEVPPEIPSESSSAETTRHPTSTRNVLTSAAEVPTLVKTPMCVGAITLGVALIACTAVVLSMIIFLLSRRIKERRFLTKETAAVGSTYTELQPKSDPAPVYKELDKNSESRLDDGLDGNYLIPDVMAPPGKGEDLTFYQNQSVVAPRGRMAHLQTKALNCDNEYETCDYVNEGVKTIPLKGI
ncbi:uncharacterized protein [Diadema antillarum]|uniref:uncharacterized protein n=1 Tax=Diadema antillarum TaxID=105358 RepID=UPI003A8C1F26